ncbi:MAG TPA: uroporphyrinogen-III synthase [Acidimicrobiales bacterium]|nr:uroporphyrinogen-III synthase [Acidimicrobiales bacterium]
MRVVATREQGSNDTLTSWLPEDATVVEVPLTTTRFYDGQEVLSTLRASDHYGTFRSLVVTSARSALYVALAREGLRDGGTVLSVGSATAKALESEDVDVDVVGEGGALDLAPTITEGPVLLLGAATMRDELTSALTNRGVDVTTLACYETLPAELTPEDETLLREADVIFIGAPSAWLVAKSFVSDAALVVVPGATTSDAVRRDHQRVIEGWGPELREHLDAL